MTKEILLNELNKIGVSCNESQLNLLIEFMHSTLSENEKFNLTAIKDEKQFIEKMILDSALMLSGFSLENKSIIDIGTGAGFPGMVLRILSPDAHITLLDSTKKKIDYLIGFAKEHNLNVKGVSDRAEDYARKNREQFDYATARAVASLPILLEIIVPLLKVGGMFIALKGPGFEEEIRYSKEALRKLNCEIDHINEFTLPECKEQRAIIFIKKMKETNKKYPRQYNEIKRQPL